MDQLLDKLEAEPHWKTLMRQSCKNNLLKTSLVNELSLLKLRSIGQRLSRSYSTIGEKVASQWLQNELKTFSWVLVAVSGLRKVSIQQFQQQQWAYLQSIFRHKDRYFLKFQAKKIIMSCNKKNKTWTEHENNLLLQLMPQFKDEEGYQWNEVARKMFEVSEQAIFRTGKHCRQRWLNHLDPSKQRGQWNPDQDLKLLSKVYSVGKKWSQFAMEFNRTEHSVKNRFNSLLMRQKKLTPEIEKQEKLVKLAKKSLEESPHKESRAKTQVNQDIIHSEVGQSLAKQPEKEDNPEKVQAGQADEQKQQSDNDNEDQAVKNQSEGILQYVRQEQQINNLVSMTECHPTIYSPYWQYSPNNGTPNNFINSSSPLFSYVNVNYNFTNCFARFTNHLQNFAVKPDENS